jgi:hypothetical protein
MGYYHTAESVDKYIEMAEGYDGRALVEVLRKHLQPGATVLELGMGPGKDLDLLSESFQATGSDVSPLFLDRYRAGPRTRICCCWTRRRWTRSAGSTHFMDRAISHLLTGGEGVQNALQVSLERIDLGVREPIVE